MIPGVGFIFNLLRLDKKLSIARPKPCAVSCRILARNGKMLGNGSPAKATRMTSPVFYILVALALTSAMISVIFFMAWKMLGGKTYALSWAVAFFAATCQWSFNLASGFFPDWETYWIIVNTFSLVVITLGIRGHCQRTNCRRLPQNLWPWAGLVYAAIAWPLASPLAVEPFNWLWVVLMGLVSVPLGFSLLTLGPRYLPAPEVGLLMLLEAVLGPILVWWVLAESPGPRGVAGGAVVVTTLVILHLVTWRRLRAGD